MTNTKIKLLLIANFVNNFAYSFFPPLFALFVAKIDASPAMVGIAWGVNMFTIGVMILLFGRYENKIQNQDKLMIYGYVLMAAGALSYLLVHNIWQLFAVQFFNAIGVGMLIPAWRTIFTKGEDKDKITLEWSWADASLRFSIATGAIAGGLILKYGDFRDLFILMAAVELIAAGIAMSLLKQSQIQEA